jgi:GT2 family glycosyltransferase
VRPDVSVIVISHNTRAHLERCLTELGERDEVIVVDTASTDGSRELVRDRFPNVQLLASPHNRGYGAAANDGMAAASADLFLVLNADAWPVQDAVDGLAEFAGGEPRAGVVGPRLLNPDGSLQPSVRGFPTLWRLMTEYLFLRWLAPRSRALNAFYGSGFDHRSQRDAEFLVGAALLVRRALVAEIGPFDTSFFMFNEEVDFCYRARAAGWRVVFWPGAEFVHVGGASTGQAWPAMYREQLRSHVRFLAKHRGLREAERARRWLAAAMRVRAVAFGLVGRRDRRALSLDAAAWLASGETTALLNVPAEG